MTRRSILATASTLPLAGSAVFADSGSPGRLKQSACCWFYQNKGLSFYDCCRNGARIGLNRIDLLHHPQWPTVRNYSLTPSMTPGAGNIPDCWNRKENHDRLEKEMRENIALAAAAKVP